MRFGNSRISMLFFADDIVLLAESQEDLEAMLAQVYKYSIKWRLKFNYDKCNVIRFDNKERIIDYGKCDQKCTCSHHFSFGPHLIKEVLVYKYLEIELNNRLTFKIFKHRILSNSKANMAKIWSMGIKVGIKVASSS